MIRTIVFTVKTKKGACDIAFTGEIIHLHVDVLSHKFAILGNNIKVSEPSEEGVDIIDFVKPTVKGFTINSVLKTPTIW